MHSFKAKHLLREWSLFPSKSIPVLSFDPCTLKRSVQEKQNQAEARKIKIIEETRQAVVRKSILSERKSKLAQLEREIQRVEEKEKVDLSAKNQINQTSKKEITKEKKFNSTSMLLTTKKSMQNGNATPITIPYEPVDVVSKINEKKLNQYLLIKELSTKRVLTNIYLLTLRELYLHSSQTKHKFKLNYIVSL